MIHNLALRGVPQIDSACLIRGQHQLDIIRKLAVALIAVCITYSLIMVIWTIYAREREFATYKKQVQGGRSRNVELERIDSEYSDDLHFTKVITKQALGYGSAYILVNIFPVVHVITGSLKTSSDAIYILHLAIRPLQGFFNFIIFTPTSTTRIRYNRALVCLYYSR